MQTLDDLILATQWLLALGIAYYEVKHQVRKIRRAIRKRRHHAELLAIEQGQTDHSAL